MSKLLFALFGNPVSHSKSPLMHNLAFCGLGMDACYTRYRLNNGEQLKEMFFTLGLKGINITVPYKESAFNACDVLDPFAQKIGVVNTIVEREGKLYGYNTDAPGFLKAISEFTEIKTVLFLGAGGTAQSTSSILRDEGYEVTLLNRSQARLEKYKADGFETYTFETFLSTDFSSTSYDLIINMTSAGLEDENLPAPKEILNVLMPLSKACVDVIYGKETPFLKLAKSYKKPYKDGSDMLLYQGSIAFEHFSNYSYTFDEIKPLMQKALMLSKV
jgi:shikimate dehydrogenase